MSTGQYGPNILFLMSDEHRADVAGWAGDTVVRTPVLDEIARTGVVFANAYTPSPICVPGRQCLMTGQLPRTCGCLVYGDDLPPFSQTWARHFARHAYRTVCAGKLHHTGPDQMQGWTQRVGGDTTVEDTFVADRDEEAFLRHGVGGRGPGWKWSDAAEIQRARAGHTRNQIFDAYAVQGTIDFVRDYFVDLTYDRATPNRPLLLKVSLLQPHYPYVTDEAKLRHYFNRVRPFVHEPVFEHPFLGQRALRAPGDVSERDVRRATAAYYGMIETIDAHFGAVLGALRDVGQDPDEWIIVYTSDHGEMLGEHGVWEKQKFFEASVRVPLVIRWPAGGLAGGRTVSENVNLCDLFATFCELAGLPLPPDLDSRSLAPLLRGDAAPWDNETISHFGRTNLMIKRGRLKYQYYGEAMPEVLFDLEQDPGETRNHADDPSHQGALAAFRARRSALGYGPNADPHYRNAGYATAGPPVATS